MTLERRIFNYLYRHGVIGVGTLAHWVGSDERARAILEGYLAEGVLELSASGGFVLKNIRRWESE